MVECGLVLPGAVYSHGEETFFYAVDKDLLADGRAAAGRDGTFAGEHILGRGGVARLDFVLGDCVIAQKGLRAGGLDPQCAEKKRLFLRRLSLGAGRLTQRVSHQYPRKNAFCHGDRSPKVRAVGRWQGDCSSEWRPRSGARPDSLDRR